MKKTIIIAILIASMGIANAQVGIQYNYLMPTSSQKASAKNLLFPKNGSLVTLGYTFPPSKSNVGILVEAGYLTMKNDNASAEAYIPSVDTFPKTFKYVKANTKGWVIKSGLVYRLPHKSPKSVKVDIEFKVGALFSNGQSIQYFNRQNQMVKEITAAKTSFEYNPNLSLDIPMSERISLKLNAGYSNLTGINTGGGIVFRLAKLLKICHCNRCYPLY